MPKSLEKSTLHRQAATVTVFWTTDLSKSATLEFHWFHCKYRKTYWIKTVTIRS